MAPPILFATENDASNANGARFARLARDRGWDVRMLAKGRAFTHMFDFKVPVYRDALREVSSDALVVLSDARDVLPLREADEFEEAWRTASGGKLLVSMETVCNAIVGGDERAGLPGGNCPLLKSYWRSWDQAWRANPAACPLLMQGACERAAGDRPVARRFVNSGLIAGTAAQVLHFIEWALDNQDTQHCRSGPNELPDDQMALGAYMCEFPQRVVADWAAALLHTSVASLNGGWASPVQAHDAPTAAQAWGMGPWFLHLPGVSNPAQKVAYEAACAHVETWGIEAIRTGYTSKYGADAMRAYYAKWMGRVSLREYLILATRVSI